MATLESLHLPLIRIRALGPLLFLITKDFDKGERFSVFLGYLLLPSPGSPRMTGCWTLSVMGTLELERTGSVNFVMHFALDPLTFSLVFNMLQGTL